MKASSILKKVACIVFGASLMYAIDHGGHGEKKETVRTERILVPIPPPPEKHVDAERVRDTFASTNSKGSCREVYGTDGVVQISPMWRVISTRFLDRVLEEQSELMRSARIVPVMRDGKTTGIQLFGVKEGGLMAMLGFQNGDELRDVNGFDLGSPEQALDAYARLRTVDQISAGIVRHGKTTRLNYVIC